MALAARRAGRRRRDGGSIAASSCASRRLSLALLLLSLVLTLCRGAADAPAGSDAAAAAPSPASCEDLLAALRANGSRDVNFATQDRGCCPPQAARAAPLGWGAPPGVAQTLRRLRHARVVLLGDSLQGQTFDALYVESVLRGVGLTRASYVCASSNHSAAAAAGAQAARGCPRDYHRMHACPKQDPDCRPVLSLAGSGLRVVYLPDVYLYGLPGAAGPRAARSPGGRLALFVLRARPPLAALTRAPPPLPRPPARVVRQRRPDVPDPAGVARLRVPGAGGPHGRVHGAAAPPAGAVGGVGGRGGCLCGGALRHAARAAVHRDGALPQGRDGGGQAADGGQAPRVQAREGGGGGLGAAHPFPNPSPRPHPHPRPSPRPPDPPPCPRATYPSHYRYGGVAPGDKPNAAAWLGEACDLGWAAPRHWTNDLAARLVGVDLPIVDAYDVMRDAGGLRSLARRNGTRFDCMHWCFEWDHLFGVVWDRIAALYA